MGDPKQDLRGSNTFKKLISTHTNTINEINYHNICHRCPREHINLSNSIVPENEKQCSERNGGVIDVYFEKDLSIGEVIDKAQYDLKYISKKKRICMKLTI